MFFLRRPTGATIARLLAAQAALPFSYAEVGVTRGALRSPLRRVHHRVKLGTGEAAFRAGAAALGDWSMHRLAWTEVHPPEAPVATGSVFATVVRHLGFWSVNPCRVVYREETSGAIPTVAFAIGTLPAHAERGEERFQVEWHRSDDGVWFDILAFAEPRHWLARAGSPVVHRLQHRFGVEAMHAMKDAVAARLA